MRAEGSPNGRSGAATLGYRTGPEPGECVGRWQRGCDVMVACDLPKVDARVRFPPPAPGLIDRRLGAPSFGEGTPDVPRFGEGTPDVPSYGEGTPQGDIAKW